MKEHIKQTAVTMAERQGLENISRSTLCSKAKVPPGSFTHIMGMSFKAFVRKLAEEGHGGNATTITKRRIDPKLRREHIVTVAFDLVKAGDVKDLTRENIARKAHVSESTITKYFNTLAQVRRDVLRKAKREKDAVVLQKLKSSRG